MSIVIYHHKFIVIGQYIACSRNFCKITLSCLSIGDQSAVVEKFFYLHRFSLSEKIGKIQLHRRKPHSRFLCLMPTSVGRPVLTASYCSNDVNLIAPLCWHLVNLNTVAWHWNKTMSSRFQYSVTKKAFKAWNIFWHKQTLANTRLVLLKGTWKELNKFYDNSSIKDGCLFI